MKNAMTATLEYLSFLSKHIKKSDTRMVLESSLIALGISSKDKAFRYLSEAVLLYHRDPSLLVVDGIYKEIAAAEENCTVQRVEITIRRAIGKAWQKRDKKTWRRFFPNCERMWPKAPTNRNFIAALADFLSLWEGCYDSFHKEVTAIED